jgi:hypothetical protein
LLGTAGAAGALVVGWSLLPPRQRLVTAQPLALRDAQVALNGWVKVAADNSCRPPRTPARKCHGRLSGSNKPVSSCPFN